MMRDKKMVAVWIICFSFFLGVVVGASGTLIIGVEKPIPTVSEVSPLILGNYYRATDVKVVDGDTLEADIRLPLDVVLDDQRVRVMGVDAWEMTGSESDKGEAAKEFVEGIIVEGEVWISPGKPSRDSFGRVLADVKIVNVGMGETLNLAEELKLNGHATVVKANRFE